MTTEEYDVRLARLEKDMYFGNGLPGMTTRMRNVEESDGRTARTLEKHDKKLDRLSWLVAIGLGIIITLEFLLRH